ncbi:MAG: hypothetical protein MUC88_21000, partial [Planctomycetes bacterium]|nr:hypothetical protein [Planctomycetota bacterium]
MRTLLLTLTTCLFVVSAVHAKYSGGRGEPNDPYQIATAADLIALGETPDDYDKHFVLTADVDLDPNLPGRKVFDKAVIASDTDPSEYSGFNGTPFTGVFDGRGHVISHLTMRGEDYVGLVGQMSWSATVKNMGVVDVNIAGSGLFVGGLVGDNLQGAVTQCYSTGAVSGGRYVGGLVGLNDWTTGRLAIYHATVTQCYSTVAVSGGDDVGGLVGTNARSSVNQCYSSGGVAGTGQNLGGLVGRNHGGSVIQCYGTGTVAGNGQYIGGLVGQNSRDVLQSFWDMETSGQSTSSGGTGRTTAEMQTGTTFLDAGWDFVGETVNGPNDVWRIVEGLTYPLLSWQKYSGGTGEPNDPYQIATAADLIALGE